MNSTPDRETYILHCWPEDGERRAQWRFRLVEVTTRQEHLFPDQMSLLRFLAGNFSAEAIPATPPPADDQSAL